MKPARFPELRIVVAILLALAPVTLASPVRAVETPHDVATDHLDAFDDGGPPSFALLANPLALLFGAFGAEGDVVLGDAAALSVEGDWVSSSGTTVYAGTVGLPVFPWRTLFHGFYLHPRATAALAFGDGAWAHVLGLGGTAGWQQTWRFGLTLRIGGGATYQRALEPGGAGLAILGVRPLLDGEIGWVF